jgi:hypothetical protein
MHSWLRRVDLSFQEDGAGGKAHRSVIECGIG